MNHIRYLHAPDSIDGSEGLLAIVVCHQHRYTSPGIQFFTEPKDGMQLAYMLRPKGYIVPAHKHCSILRTDIGPTQEVLIVKSGRVSVTLYTSDGQWAHGVALGAGDLILLLRGGHRVEFLEESELYECKSGPYLGTQEKIPLDVKGI